MNLIETQPAVCRNLWPDAQNPGILRPVGKAPCLAKEGYTPILAIDRRTVVMSSRSGTSVFDTETCEFQHLTGAQAQSAFVDDDDKLVVFTYDGPMMFAKSPSGSYSASSGATADFAPISITAEPMSGMEMHIDAVTLSTEYLPGDKMVESDKAKIISAVSVAYNHALADCRARGVLFEPVMARYVVKDNRGRTIHRGPVQLVMPPGGPAFDTPVMMSMSAHNLADATTVALPAYRLRVVAHPMAVQAVADRAATLCLEITPQLACPASDMSTAQVNVIRTGATGTPAIAFSMPVDGLALSSSDSARNQRIVNALLAHFDDICLTEVVASAPYEHGVDRVVGIYGNHTSLDAKRVFATVPAASKLRSLVAPHTFAARYTASTPLCVAFGNIKALSYAGYTAADYAAKVDSVKAWTSITRTVFEGGDTAVREFCGTGSVPRSLSPLVIYPDASVSLVEVTVKVDGEDGVLHWRIPMSPDASGIYAMSLTPDLSERQPDGAGDWPAEVPSTSRRAAVDMPGLIAVAAVGDPFALSAFTDLGAEIRSLVRATSSSSAWDYGRSRFNSFTEGNVYLVNASAGMDRLVAAPIANEGITSPSAVTVSDSATVYYAGNGGGVYSINGSRVGLVATLPREVDILGFDPTDRRLQAWSGLGFGEDVYHIDPTTGKTVFTTASPGASDCAFTVGDRLLAPTQDFGLLDMAVAPRVGAEAVGVTLISRIPGRLTPKLHKVKAVVWNIDADDFSGELTAERFSVSLRRVAFTTFRLGGKINSPVRMPLITRPVVGGQFEMRGVLSADGAVTVPMVEMPPKGGGL